MNSNHCTITETFSNFCGHLTTTVKHWDHCRDANSSSISFSNNSDGQRFILSSHRLENTRWAGAQITESKCTVCELVEQNTPLSPTRQNCKSDLNCPELNATELATQREYWKNFVADHAFLSQRQNNLSEAYRAAVRELKSHNEENSEVENSERRNELLENVERAKKAQDFYDLEQNYYFKIVRSMGFFEMSRLFDPTNLTSLTHELLYHIKPEDIPSGEICAICANDLNSAGQSDNIRRVFCGNHLFHEECIVVWFETRQGRQVTCPMCRRIQNFYRTPPDDWHQPDQFNAEDFFNRVEQWNPNDSDRDMRPLRERIQLFERMQSDGHQLIAQHRDVMFRIFDESGSIEGIEGLGRIEQETELMFRRLHRRLRWYRQNIRSLIEGSDDLDSSDSSDDSDGSDGSDGSYDSDGLDDSGDSDNDDRRQ